MWIVSSEAVASISTEARLVGSPALPLGKQSLAKKPAAVPTQAESFRA